MIRFWLCCLLVALLPGAAAAQDIPRADDTITFAPDSTAFISPDFSHVLALRPEGEVIIHDVGTNEERSAQLGVTVRGPLVRWEDGGTALLIILDHDLFLVDSTTAGVRLVYHAGDDEKVSDARFIFYRYVVARVATTVSPSYGSDLETHVWDAASLDEILLLPAGDDCLTATPDHPFAAEIVAFMREFGGFYGPCGSIDWNPDQTRYLNWTFWNNGTGPIEVHDAGGNPLYEIRQCAVFSGGESGPDCPLLAGMEDVQWSPDGRMIAALPSFYDAPLALWDASSGALLHELPPPGGDTPLNVTGMRWSDDGHIASFGLGGIVYLWDAATGDLLFHWQDVEEPVTDCRFLYHDALLLCWTQYSPFFKVVGGIWNTRSGENVALITSDTAIVEDAVEDPQTGLLYLNFGYYVEIWDLGWLAEHWSVEPG